jgi:hypothetical protein
LTPSASIHPVYTFRRTTNGAAIVAQITDFFTSPSLLEEEILGKELVECYGGLKLEFWQ